MNVLLASFVVLVPLSIGWAQTARTNGTPAPAAAYNLVSISNAVRIASGLRVGMSESEVQKYMHDHGMTNEWRGTTNMFCVSLDRGRTLNYPYPIADPSTLTLEMHCTSAPPGLFGWSNPVLARAYIQSQATNIISITLINGP